MTTDPAKISLQPYEFTAKVTRTRRGITLTSIYPKDPVQVWVVRQILVGLKAKQFGWPSRLQFQTARNCQTGIIKEDLVRIDCNYIPPVRTWFLYLDEGADEGLIEGTYLTNDLPPKGG